MIRHVDNKHIFAVYYEAFDFLLKGQLLFSDDLQLIHRLRNVLRLEVGDAFVIFNTRYYTRAVIEKSEKKNVILRLESFQSLTRLQPFITVLLPLLKKEAFEESLSVLTSLGVQKIQPLLTEKIHHMWLTAKENERLHRIMIAAAEQSKQFILPQLLPVISLKDALLNISSSERIFFDAQGTSAATFFKSLPENAEGRTIICLIGPEGDLSETEKEEVKKHQFTFCKLTPSILRAEQALFLGVGMIRSWYH